MDKDKFIEELIKNAVNKFLGWKLPDDFNPDGGISFKKEFNEHTEHPMKNEPVGTHLFSAQQAEEMIRYILKDSLSHAYSQGLKKVMEEIENAPNNRINILKKNIAGESIWLSKIDLLKILTDLEGKNE